ncbi:hypothetical protein [Aminobacter sp. Piv2-1]|uniref:hypothetical protein n=1 Tax=Aminobacter sp. Piv2-1 TaxID=3031122 RepID=UPI0030B35A82
MGVENELAAFLAIGWLFAFMLVIASLFRPVPPFRTRLQALLLGLPTLIFGPFLIGIALGWAPEPRDTARSQPSASQAAPVAAAPDTSTAAQTADAGSSSQAAGTAEPQVAPTLKVVALTHINRATGKRVTYLEPRTKVLVKQDVPEGAWTVASSSLQVVCFADGNNAVLFTMDGRFIAANGKARQFVRYGDGDGIILDNDTVVPVEELERGKHVELVSAVIDAGLELCGQKSIEEIGDALRKATNDPAPTSPALDNEALLNAALAIKGGEHCQFDFDAPKLVDYLEENGVDQARFTAEIEPYLAIAVGIIAGSGKDYCREKLLPKFGPAGFGIVSVR